VEDAILDVLNSVLPRTDEKPFYDRKSSALYEHIYESYPSGMWAVYAEAN